jgi:hypothetical protein
MSHFQVENMDQAHPTDHPLSKKAAQLKMNQPLFGGAADIGQDIANQPNTLFSCIFSPFF